MIIVTGGAGFIGSGVIRHLNEQGIANIVVVDEFDHTDKWKNLVKKKFKEIVQKEQFFDWLRGRETEILAIIHLGACSSTVEKNSGYLLENNTRFTIKLAEYALKNEIRFIYASSAATYGDGSLGFSDDHAMLDELEPLNMYGYSKHLVDLWLKEQGVLSKVVGLKYFNVYGPNEYHKGRMASAVCHILPTARKEGVIKLFKSDQPQKFPDGEQCRDFIYVKDAARMTCAFLTNSMGGIYNIGRGVPGTWNQLARGVFKALGIPERIEYIDFPEDLVGKYQNYTCAEMQKTRDALGEAAFCQDLESSVSDYINNYLIGGKTW